MKSYALSEINNLVKGELIGNTNQKIKGPETLKKANNNQITFIGSKKHQKFWEDSKACAALVSDNINIELYI